MSAFLVQMQGAVSQGILWGIMVLGVYITYKVLDIADLTVDGSFALGGCVCALLVVEKGFNPFLASMLALLAGALAGLVTGALHTAFDIPAILAGILTQLGLWSINLRVMGKSNTPFLKVDTLVTQLSDLTGLSNGWAGLAVGAVVAVVIILLLYWFFGTELGSAIEIFIDPKQALTKRLVSAAVRRGLPNLLQHTQVVPEYHEGAKAVVELLFLGPKADAPVIVEVAKICDVSISILSGDIDHIQNEPFGIMAVEIGGARSEIEHAIDEFKQRVHKVEVLGYDERKQLSEL